MAFCTTCGTATEPGTYCANCGERAAEKVVETGASAETKAAPAPKGPKVAPVVQPAAAPAQTPGFGETANTVAYRTTNALAIVSLVASLLGFFTFGLGSLAGIVCGHIALSQIKTKNQDGGGMAVAGLVIGYSPIGLALLLIVLFSGYHN
jgi:hypothetical protein